MIPTNGPDENESPFDQTPEEIEAQREEAAKRERKATRKARRAAKREAAEAQTQDAQPRRGGEPPALVVAPPTDADGATHWLDETPERRSPVAAGKTERGLEAVLDAMKVKLRWNVLSQKVEYQAAAEGEGWQELDDRWGGQVTAGHRPMFRRRRGQAPILHPRRLPGCRQRHAGHAQGSPLR